MVLKLWADVKYHVPTGFGFSPKASGFYPFGDATDLAGEGGVGDVVWLIQASASSHKPKEPSLWFVLLNEKFVCLNNISRYSKYFLLRLHMHPMHLASHHKDNIQSLIDVLHLKNRLQDNQQNRHND